MAVVLGTLGVPLPLYAAACAPQHSCCAPAAALTLDAPDCCEPTVCAPPEKEVEAAVPAPVQALLAAIGDLPDEVAVAGPVVHARRHSETASPPLMRVRLARLSTLLI